MRLDAEHEAALARRALRGDRAAAHELVTAHLHLATLMARGRKRTGESMPDLEQEAALALLHAAEWYDPDRGARFAEYAAVWIRIAFRRLAREGGVVRLTKHGEVGLREIVAAARAFRRATQTEPSTAELAAAVGLDEVEVVRALGASARIRSLDEPLREGSTRTAADELRDPGPDPERQAITRQQRDELARRLTLLSPREARVVTQRAADRSLRAIARDEGISHESVRDVERRARALLGCAPLDDSPACARGHAWTDASSYVGVDGRRRCKPCRMSRRRERAHAS